MRVLIDTNVILDALLNRQQFFVEAKQIWEANILHLFDGYISAITPVNVFYITCKQSGLAQAQIAIKELLANFQVCLIDQAILQAAEQSAITDFEDAVQHQSALASGLDTIVTRDLNDFAGATLTVLSPSTFLKALPPLSPPATTP